MPTATDFDRAAVELEAAAADLAVMASPIHRHLGPETFHGGRLPLLATMAVDDSQRLANEAATELTELAGLCRLRADVCRQHESALEQFHRDLARWQSGEDAPTARPPDRPRRPASWVET